MKEGDVLEVMPPSGNFTINEENKHVVGICAGSGITPILSMIKVFLAKNLKSSFTLIFGNQSKETTMFLNEIVSLEKDSDKRLKVYWLFSRENVK